MARSGEMKGSLSLLNAFSGDPFLQLCSSSAAAGPVRRLEAEDGGEEGIELSLGLSLNGKFGVDPNKAQNMHRSSSVSHLPENGVATHAPLTRTCTFPAAEGETEEWRKKKDLRTQKRLEAKRKRMEKMNSTRNVRSKLPEKEEERNPLLPTISPGSSLSQGSGSSGISDFDSQPLPASGKIVQSRSPSVQSGEEQTPPVATPEPPVNKSSNPSDSPKNNNGVLRNLMMNMPCVSTKGEGPNGKKIEGFLYRYKKGEEVRIVCVCHGSFLTPAEFVKHAGGGDVAHPLKHITVTPTSFF